jgi:hypothetical protein
VVIEKVPGSVDSLIMVLSMVVVGVGELFSVIAVKEAGQQRLPCLYFFVDIVDLQKMPTSTGLLNAFSSSVGGFHP